MLNYYLYKNINNLKPVYRRSIILIVDILVFALSFLISNFIFINSFVNSNNNLIFIFFVLIGISFYCFSGQYKGLTRYVGSSSLYFLALRNLFIVSLTITLMLFFGLADIEIRFWFVIWVILTTFTGLIRLILRDFLLELRLKNSGHVKKIIIYGAGEAGAQLAASLRLAKTYSIVAFLDDNPLLWNRNIYGVNIKCPNDLYKYKNKIDLILFAIPSISINKKKKIFLYLKKFEIPILQIPLIADLLEGKAAINEFSPINIEELLGRDRVIPDEKLLGPGITKSFVLITGAGGSIGSEISRQVISLDPKLIVLLDSSEENLYKIHKELLQAVDIKKIIIKPILGNASDLKLLREIFSRYKFNVLFHAAAYKHVPLIELNKLAGISNNLLTSLAICKVSEEFNIDKVILISSDKAVRPTNVMGASKRLSEMIWQTYAERALKIKKTNQSKKTIFAMVRFGNVLDSSGSVVPLFKEQIKKGGPITLTHKEVIRYFMTIPEAAELVIQASVIAESGDVLILDMGDPIRILDLAKQMINLSGLKIKSDKNPNGDIEIKYIGLREGEKLFEELLIDAKSEKTIHPMIFRAQEKLICEEMLFIQLENLKESLQRRDSVKSLEIVSKLIPEWDFKK